MRDFTEKDIQKLCESIPEEERKKEQDKLQRQYYDGEHVYNFTEEELEQERRKRALRKYIEFEEQERANRPGLIFTWVMLILEFYMIKELCFAKPYDIYKILFGIFMMGLLWVCHWGARA